MIGTINVSPYLKGSNSVYRSNIMVFLSSSYNPGISSSGKSNIK